MIKYIFLFFFTIFSAIAFAHPMPNSVVLMDIRSKGVSLELQLPLSELQLAFGNDVATNPTNLVERLNTRLKSYILAHIKPFSDDGKPWKVEVLDMEVGKSEQTATGPYQELVVHLWMEAPAGASNRIFTLNYDIIIHQVVTHSALISVRQDWEAALTLNILLKLV